VALFDVLDEAGVGGLPAQEFLGDGAAAALRDLQVRAAELTS